MNVVFIDTVHPILWELLTEANFNCIDSTDNNLADVLNDIQSAQGIVVRSRYRMDEEFLKNAPSLKFIARSGAGMENIDEAYCSSQGIVLFNAPEGNRNAVGEHALGMLLSLFNRIHLGNAEIRNGKWDREGNRGIELDGKTVGIIGFGNNGKAFAKKLRGFDVTVLAYDKYLNNFGDSFVKESSLEEIFKSCDIVSFHIPQNEETIYFADDSFFHSFSHPIYLINLSRGKVVKTSALVNALKSGTVLGACLDVLEYEKSSFESFFEQSLSEDFEYLLSSEKVILTPHVGGWTHESYYKLSKVLADKILAEYSN